LRVYAGWFRGGDQHYAQRLESVEWDANVPRGILDEDINATELADHLLALVRGTSENGVTFAVGQSSADRGKMTQIRR
jgi:hypothetical protein